MSAPDSWMVIKVPLYAELAGVTYDVGTLTFRADGTQSAHLDTDAIRETIRLAEQAMEAPAETETP
jgi:hypothetical protein